MALTHGFGTHLLMERKDHMWKTGKLEKHKENELTGEMLPQELARPTVIKLLLGFRSLHGVNHQVHQLVLQHRAALLVLQAEIKYRIPKASRLV